MILRKNIDSTELSWRGGSQLLARSFQRADSVLLRWIAASVLGLSVFSSQEWIISTGDGRHLNRRSVAVYFIFMRVVL